MRNDPAFHDTGRQEITGNPNHAFKFRSLTLRQLKDAGTFFHNGSFTTVRDVIQYFNAGLPQDPAAGAAATLDARFTHPRGTGSPRGLGLDKADVDAVTDFIENGLHDAAFVRYDPNSTTPTLQPNERDLTYSKYRPDLAALGAVDGFVPSGLAMDNNDALSRRDQGLEFLDVTAQAHIDVRADDKRGHGRRDDKVAITNNSTSIIDTHLLVIVRGLSGARLVNASGTTKQGDPYVRVFLPAGELQPGQRIVQALRFQPNRWQARRLNYSVQLLSGQGQP